MSNNLGKKRYEAKVNEALERTERDLSGIWIPIEIWEDLNLTPFEVMLLAEINSLDRGGGCGKRDRSLARRMGCTMGHIANELTSLRKRGYLKTIKSDRFRRALRTSFSRHNANPPSFKSEGDIHFKMNPPSFKSEDNREYIENNSEKPVVDTTSTRTFGLEHSQSTIEKMCTRFARFTESKSLHIGNKGARREGWESWVVKKWKRPLEDLLDQVGNIKEIEHTMQWYFDHYDDDFTPRTETMGSFCRNYTKYLRAIERAQKDRDRNRNGHTRPKEFRPGGFVNGKRIVVEDDL